MYATFRQAICLTLISVTPLWGLPGRAVFAGQSDAPVDAERQKRLAENDVEAIPVVLSKDQKLRGLAKTKNGVAAANATVVLGVNGKPVGRVIADDQGRFEFGPLKSGKYQLATRDAVAMLAVYTLNDHPAEAEDSIELSQDAMIARGQNPGKFFTNPWFIGLIVAAAIAIPLAIVLSDDDDDDAS